jgi:hypothetical protein
MEPISPVLAERILQNAPRERDPRYFRTWQRVSLALQRALRSWISERYFLDSRRFEDRDAAYPILVYAACRLCHGRPKTEFTYDVADTRTVTSAMHNIGATLKLILEPVEKRLREEDKNELGRRYSVIWRQDILREVRRRPKTLITLLASEANMIDAVIDFGTSGDPRRFSRLSKAALRTVLGDDLRDLVPRVLEESDRVLAELKASGFPNLIDARIAHRDDAISARRPDFRIGGEEDRDDRNADGCSQVSDSGIISDVHTRRSEPAGELIKVVVSDSVLERIFGSGNPLHRAVQSAGDSSEIF